MLVSYPRGKTSVLVADDFGAFRQFLRSKLQDNGFQNITEASDGLEAVAKAAELQPDLILLDIGMPKLNGIEAAARIHTVAPQSKILFVSQLTDSDIAQSALSDGAKGYVRKSETNRELLTAIEAVLKGQRFVSAGLRPAQKL